MFLSWEANIIYIPFILFEVFSSKIQICQTNETTIIIYNILIYSYTSLSIHVSVQLHTKYLFVQESLYFYNFLPNCKYFLSVHIKIVVPGNNNKLSIDTTQVIYRPLPSSLWAFA